MGSYPQSRLRLAAKKAIDQGVVVAVSAVWFGFRHLDRRARVKEGERKPTERTMGERLRKKMRDTTGASRSGDSAPIEDTEKCVKCGAFVAVGTDPNCGRSDCPYS